MAISWSVTLSPTFLNELLGLPQHVSRQVTQKVKVLERDPISAQGDAKKLKGYQNMYRVRIGDYRLFYSFGQGWVKLISVRKRDDRTYEDEIPETGDPAVPPPAPDTLDPQATPTQTFAYQIPEARNHIAEPGAAYATDDVTDNSDAAHHPINIPAARPLPFLLTDELLHQWQVAPEHWVALRSAGDEDALLSLDLPNAVLERILDNLFPRSIDEIVGQPDLVLQQPEDLDRFIDGDLTTFLLKLDPAQERIVAADAEGPTLVKGGPGTGKSVVALHRVKRLLDRGATSVLFTTYTNALVGYSEQLLEALIGDGLKQRGVEVATVDGLAMKHYAHSDGRATFATDGQMTQCLEHALAHAEIPGANAFDRKVRRETLTRLGNDYLIEEFQNVIESWGLTSSEAYLSTTRVGRKVPLRAPVREAIWSVYLVWRAALHDRSLITWGQLRMRALELALAMDIKPYQAVVVDEAQDLTPVSIRFLLALVETPQGIYLTADGSQSIYQRGFSWRQVHEDLQMAGRTMMLRRNYRNTAEIARACEAILRGSGAGDDESLAQEVSPYRGDPPSLVENADEHDDARIIQEFFGHAARRYRLPIHSGAVLCHSQHVGTRLAAQLTKLGLPAEVMTGRAIDIKKPCVKILTLHAAKGLEFPFVAIIRLEEGAIPRSYDHLPEEEAQAFLDQQRRLFFVGCSRAMRALLVCGSQSSPSPFAEPLTAPHWRREAP